MEHVKTLRTYLQMHGPPALRLPPPVDSIAIEHLSCPTVAQYRNLYNTVGRDYNWADRNLMADEDLQQVLFNELVEVHLLRVRGEAAGYGELDRRTADNIEVAYFGLFPPFVGQGLGKYFLNWILHKAWSYAPVRVWLHTCTLDHPAALPMYLSAGLEIFDRKMILQQLPPQDH